MKYNRRALYDQFVSFYHIISDDECSEAQLRGKMGHFVRKARREISPDWAVEERIHHLLQLIYGDWGFHCDPERYFYARNLYLPYVLEYREGMPVTLGAIVLYLAEALNLPIYPVNFPTQLILRAEVGDKVAFIDPWNGQYISQEKLQQLYEGTFGFGAKIQPEELDRADLQLLETRFEQLAKNALIREEHNEIAFRYIEKLLCYSDDPTHIRDRGIVLAQMGAYPAALKDLEYFVDKCPNDPTAALIRVQLLEIKGEFEQAHELIH
ncbi:SirB1 family protein [Rodentibacter trehalosifermentans]|uniref:Protein SirB1 N-terminal domain-containing protein n=1 Tax=Rodentibacter trehalosifermentans TaxID=1908263 RepID=A0A1V3IZJ1_9PAST|nr:SirB1 family protein [Rodentibacter trehalosifermentans]OOF47833.1 hypothetical protein BKK52_07650 [Rodentibacter trehalosifermentans]OOF53639.1 hypothetical protein BKK53_00545 [Rodentibacter trehalosifermentans]